MRFLHTMYSMALLAATFGPAAALAQAPDPREVARLQAEVQKSQAKGDWTGAAVELRILARQYKNDPAMLSNTYSQLAAVYAPHDARRAAEYRALAQSATAAPAPLPAYPAQSVYPPQPAYATQPAMSPQPTSEIPAPIALPAGGAPKMSATEKLTKILAEAEQIMQQAKQVQAAMKKKGTDTPQTGQPMPQPGGFPPAPDSTIAPQPAQPATGVVVGYDANNQPIFAPAAPATPAAATPVAAGVVIGYDANNQPIFAPAPPHR